MERPWILDYDTSNCSIGAAVGIIGERQTFLVLRETFNGVRRFADIQRRTAMPRQVLSDRLARLVDEGLLSKVPYQDSGQRRRDEYRLTAKGLDLYPVLVALMAWGDKYEAARKARRSCSVTATAGSQYSCSCPAAPGTSSARPVTSPSSPAPARARSPERGGAGRRLHRPAPSSPRAAQWFPRWIFLNARGFLYRPQCPPPLR